MPEPIALPPEVRAAALDALGGSELHATFVWMNYPGTVWRLDGGGGSLFLKHNRDLAGERDRLAWLHGRLPVPDVVGMFSADGDDWLLTAARPGVPPYEPSVGWDPKRVARFFGETLRSVHATDSSGCPFGEAKPGNVLIHGDYCLPNVLVSEGRLSGILDVGRSGLGDPRLDLGAGIWTLQYNFKAGFARDFLDAYGAPPMTDEQIEKLRRTYAA